MRSGRERERGVRVKKASHVGLSEWIVFSGQWGSIEDF